MKKDWMAPVYAFYRPEVTIRVDRDAKHTHEFNCANHGYKTTVTRWLDKKDKNLTGNLWKHVKKCWGAEALASADALGSATKARDGVKVYLRSGDLTLSFVCTGKGKVTYSVCQHMRNETRLVHYS